VRFISHRDVARAFERAFRVARLPLAFTGGFAPRPKMSFGLALPLGYESDAEYLDVELTEPIDLAGVSTVVTDALPAGIAITGAAFLVERAASLQEAVVASTWEVEVAGDRSEVLAAVERLLASDRIDVVRSRKGRTAPDDIRPAIHAIGVAGMGPRGGVLLTMDLAARPRSVRPSEVLAVIDADEVGVVRTHQWIERDGARLQPLDADTRTHVLEARAS
jgi:radical SAM-linked protein